MDNEIGSRKLSVLNTREQADILLEPKTMRYLSPFRAGNTAEEASRLLGVSLNTLMYQIQRLKRAGLLEIEKEIARAGRPLKRDRTTAKEFFVPFNISRFDRPEELMLEEYVPVLRRILGSFLLTGAEMMNLNSFSDFGLLVSANESGEFIARHSPNPALDLNYPHLEGKSPAILALWKELTLDFEDAKALQKKLNSLFGEYSQKSGSKKYLVNVFLTPDRSVG